MNIKVYKPMLAHEYVKHIKSVKFPVAVQPKIDGIRALSTTDGLYSRQGIKIISMPHISALVTAIPGLDGELYSDELSFEEICSVVNRRIHFSNDFKKIKYNIFDFCNECNFKERYALAKKCVDILNSEYVNIVPTFIVNSQAEINSYLDKFTNEGYEGVMIRSLTKPYEEKRTTQLLKLKKSIQVSAVIEDMEEGKGKYARTLGSLLCRTDASIPVSVGSGFDDDTRKLMWKRKNDYIGKRCILKCQELTKNGVPRFPTLCTIL